MSYYLKVYDNFNYMEEGDVYLVKGIRTPEVALGMARGMVESYFEENWDFTELKSCTIWAESQHFRKSVAVSRY